MSTLQHQTTSRFPFGAAAVKFLGSPRANFILLGLLLGIFFIGMVTRQVHVGGFSHYYYNLPLTRRRVLYRLGFFDIYHSWYFAAVVIASAVSIVASGVTRLASSLSLITPTDCRPFQEHRIREYALSVQLSQNPKPAASVIAREWDRLGFKTRTLETTDGIVVVGQQRRWNRLAPFFLLASILTILIGFFLTTRFGLVGEMVLKPGVVTNSLAATTLTPEGPQPGRIALPFEVECLGVSQKLIHPKGGLDPANSMDWTTSLRIMDSGKQILGQVQLNAPLGYRDYWFYQAGYRGLGDASQVTVRFAPMNRENGTEVTLQRNGSAAVPGIGSVSFVRFFSDVGFSDGDPVNMTDSYRNPAVQLKVETDSGQTEEVLAMSESSERSTRSDEKKAIRKGLLRGGAFKAVLQNYDKSATYHILSVDRDIGRLPTYIGFVSLVAVIAGMLCFSHQRIWAVIETNAEQMTDVRFSGDTNRYPADFEVKFEELTDAVVSALALHHDGTR